MYIIKVKYIHKNGYIFIDSLVHENLTAGKQMLQVTTLQKLLFLGWLFLETAFKQFLQFHTIEML